MSQYWSCLGAAVAPVLGVGGEPAAGHAQPRQDDALVGADWADLRVLDLTRPHVVDPGQGLHAESPL